MKTPEFFIDKANEYSKLIDELSKDYIHPFFNNFAKNPNFIDKSSEISDLKLKVRLLLSEFDNGDFFIAEIADIDKNAEFMFKEDERLKAYKHILSLFVEHLIEFRK